MVDGEPKPLSDTRSLERERIMSSDYIPSEQRSTCRRCGGVVARRAGDRWQHRTPTDEYVFKNHRAIPADEGKKAAVFRTPHP